MSSSPDIASSTTAASEEEPIFLEELGESAGGCERVVEFDSVALGLPPPFDVVIVADHSGSLAWSRQDLAEGLKELLADVYGHAVRFFVLTPTQYGETSADAIRMSNGDPLVNWQDSVTGSAYSDAVTRYSQVCTDALEQEIPCPGYPPPNMEFTIRGTWDFVMPSPVATLTSDMTPEQLAGERAKVVDAVLTLGTSGSPEQRPLCTLHRYIQQAPELLPDRAVFLVISDEDDEVGASDCYLSSEFSRTTTLENNTSFGCSSNCDGYRYSHTRPVSRNTLHYECAPMDDQGVVAPDAPRDAQTWNASYTESCEPGPLSDCNDADQSTAERLCGTGFAALNCQRQCDEGEADRICQYTTERTDVDLCDMQPFEWADETYENLTDWCDQIYRETGWQQCSRSGFTREEASQEWQDAQYTQSVLPVYSAIDATRLFHIRADRALGAENYFVEAIVFDPVFECVPEAGQSYATNLRHVASSAADIFPICDSYAPALARVDEFAQELLQTEYSLSLNARESIESVVVESRDGSTRELNEADYDHDRNTDTLRLQKAALRSADLRLSVEVVDPCVPRAR